MNLSKIRRIAFKTRFGLGDLITTLIPLAWWHELCPHASIDFFLPKESFCVLRAYPFVKLRDIAEALEPKRYDLFLHFNSRSLVRQMNLNLLDTRHDLFCKVAGLIPEFGAKTPCKFAPRLVADRQLRAKWDRKLSQFKRPIVGLIERGRHFKAYPRALLSELAELLRERGYTVIGLGHTCCEIENTVARFFHLSLDSFLALLSVLNLAICSDQGAMHALAALGVPHIVIFGPTKPSLYFDRSRLGLWRPDPHPEFCSPPCLLTKQRAPQYRERCRPCPLLLNVKPATVAEAADEILSAKKLPFVRAGSLKVRRLNVGCGLKPTPGWVNLDLFPPADVCADIRHLPFGDAVFDSLRLTHVLEHVRDELELRDGKIRQLNGLVMAMNECWRVLRAGGILEIRVPHYKTAIAYGDPEHVRFFSEASFDHWTKEKFIPMNARYGIRGRFKLEVLEAARPEQRGLYFKLRKID